MSDKGHYMAAEKKSQNWHSLFSVPEGVLTLNMMFYIRSNGSEHYNYNWILKHITRRAVLTRNYRVKGAASGVNQPVASLTSTLDW